MRRTRGWSLLVLTVWLLAACAQPPWKQTTVTPEAVEVWPPVVTNYQPASGQEVSPDALITIRFDQPMERRRTEDAFSIEPSVNGSFIWQDVRTLLFRPRASLSVGTEYRVRIAESARSLAGTTLAAPLEFTFTTRHALSLAQVLPADGASDLRVDSPILVTFNGPVVSERCLGEDAANLKDCPVLPVSLTPTVLTRGMWVAPDVYQITPYPGWNAGTSYELTLRGEITAWNEERIQIDRSSRFSVARAQVVRVEPLQHQTAALPPDTSLSIYFNQPMDPQATAAAFSLTDEQNTPVPGVLHWNEDKSVLHFTPSQPLALATRYTLKLDSRARAVTSAPIDRAQSWIFETIPAPTVSVIAPRNGSQDVPLNQSVRFAVQGLWDEATLRAGIVISPAVPAFNVHYQNGVLSVAWDRAPRTLYCVTIPAGLEDAYGQTLTQGAQTCFTTGNLPIVFEPALENDTLIIDAGKVARLTFLARNVTRVSFQLYRVDEQSFMTNAPVSGTPLRDWVERFTVSDPNSVQVLNVDVMRGNPLRSGFYQLQWADPASGALRRVRLAVVDVRLNVQLGREEALVWVTPLRSTAPITGVQTRLLERGVLLAAGTTNAEGLVQLRYEPRAEIYTPLFVVTGEPGSAGFGLASTAWHQHVAPWDFGLGAQYDTFPVYTLWGFTDKPLYRPLESIAFAGLVRQRSDATYALPASLARVQVTLTDPQGKPIYDAALSLSSQGTFAGQIPIPYASPAGEYTLRVTAGSDQAAWETSVQVIALGEEEAFRIMPILASDELVLTASTTITVRAAYGNGAPVAHAQGRYEVWRMGTPSAELLASAPLESDAQGIARIPLPRADHSELWLLRVTLTDAEGRQGSLNHRLRIHASAVYPEARLNSQLGRVRQATTLQVRAVDWNGAPVAGVPLTVTLVRRTWQAPAPLVPLQSAAWQAQETVVATQSLASSEDWSNVSLIPGEAGEHEVWISLSDGITHTLALYVVGNTPNTTWRQGAAQLSPVSDKATYRAGETAQILLPLGTESACRVLMTVARESIILRRFYDFNEPMPLVGLPISQEFVPDVYVTFTAFCPDVVPAVRSGILHLNIQPVLQTLLLDVVTERTSYAPGESVKLTLRVRDAAERPVEGAQVWLVVNEALPGLDSANGLMDTFYTHPMRTIQGDTGHALMDYWSPLLAPLDTEGAAAWLQARSVLPQAPTRDVWPPASFTQSPATLVWEPALSTNANGEVQVSFTLPERVTSWRVRAFAVAGDTQMGENQAVTLDAREPVRLTPYLPQALSAGDEITLGVQVDNLTQSPITPTLTLLVDGAMLLSSPTLTASLQPAHSQVYTWTLRVPKADITAVTLRYEARLEDVPKVSVSRTLPVKAQSHLAHPVLTGLLRPEEVLYMSFFVPSQAETGTTLHVDVYPTLADWLDAQRAIPPERAALDNEAAALHLLALATLRLDTQAAVATLYPRQHNDGGWGWWPDEATSTLHESALVSLALHEAQRAGQAVDAKVLAQGLDYVARTLTQSLKGEKNCTPDQALALLALTSARYRWPDEAPQALYTCRQSLGITGQAYLALALGEVDAADPRLKTLLNNLANAARPDGTWYEVDPRYHITPERATALALLAQVTLQPNRGNQAAALLPLLSPQLPARERAWGLLAVRRYVEQQSQGAGKGATWQLTLNATQQVTYTTQEGAQRLTFPLAQLRHDATQHLELRHQGGEAPVYYVAYLALHVPATETSSDLSIRRQYCRPELSAFALCTPVEHLAPGDTLEVRLHVTVPTTRTQVVLQDHLPAGLSVIPEAAPNPLPMPTSVTLRPDGIEVYAPLLAPGVYEVRYRARAIFTGRFTAIPATVAEVYRSNSGTTGVQSFWVIARKDVTDHP